MAWSETNGTKVLSNIIPTNPSDTYPTHLDKFGRGGYKAVTSIAENAFISCDSLTSVTLPTTLTEVHHSAFRRCSNLKEISI